jgi:hypothetical protein
MNIITKLKKKYYREYRIEQLIIDLDLDQKKVYRELLNNTIEWYFSFSKKGKLPIDFLLTLSKRVLDKIQDIRGVVSVQPMTTPCAQIYSLQYDAKDDGVCLSVIKNAILAQCLKTTRPIPLEDIRFANIESISSEIANIIKSNIVTNLAKLSGINDKFTEGDVLPLRLQRIGNNIARHTRRGVGNLLIVSPDIFEEFKAEKSKYLPVPYGFESVEDEFDTPGLFLGGELFVETENAGVVDKVPRFKVYVSCILKNSIIVGYKGASEIDAGYIYSPYMVAIPLDTTVINPITYDRAIPFISREGKWHKEKTETSNCDVSNYYELLQLNVL